MKTGCAGYCGEVATTSVIQLSPFPRDSSGRQVKLGTGPATKVPLCESCFRQALDGDVTFTYCERDRQWGRTDTPCQGGCGRLLVGRVIGP